MKKLILTLICSTIVLFSCTRCSQKEEINVPEEYEIVNIESDWFSVGYLDSKTYIIEEKKSSQYNVSYFIFGDNKAIMFDTGSGENEPISGLKIKNIVDQLTELPTSLLLSHFHFDHNQNIEEFEHVSFPELEFLRNNVGENQIYEFTDEDLFYGDYPSQIHIDEWLPLDTDIDLGNKIIQLVNLSGHSKESIAIIDKTNKLAFLGDFIYNGTLFAFSLEDLNLYKESVDRLILMLDSEYKLYGAHGNPEIDFNKLQLLSELLYCININNCEGENSTVWGYDVKIYEHQGMQILVFL